MFPYAKVKKYIKIAKKKKMTIHSHYLKQFAKK